MIKCCFAVILSLSAAVSVSAQRYGRADAIQNYMRGGQSDPRLLLQIRIQGKRLYFRRSDLRKMARSAVILPDPTTGTTHTYEGVDFETLIPSTAYQSGSDIIEISFDTHQTMTISRADLDPAERPIVVDTVDGKKLTGYVPYYFIARTRQNNAAPIKNVRRISVKSSSRSSAMTSPLDS
jgi:hypothetical protein